MPVTFTTDLPDADQPVLGNGVEDEIAVNRGTQSTTYGVVRWQVRETDQSSWDSSATGFAEGTVPYDTLQFAIVGREDGEQYEVRLRTETEHRTGSWTAPVAITTKFPGAANPSATASSRTTVVVEWTDVSDNEAGFVVERRTVRDDGTRSAWRTLVDLEPNTAAYTDDTARPATTLEYRVKAYTDDADATSAVTTATTPASRLESSPRAATGWSIEIDHPSGQTLRPDLIGDPQYSPQINGMPTLTVSVRGEWVDDSLDGADARAWHAGTRLPVDHLSGVAMTSTGSELRLGGSREMDTHVRRSIRQAPAHQVIDELVQSNTSLKTNIDDPAVGTGVGLPVLSASDPEELVKLVDGGLSATDPLVTTDTGLRPSRTAITFEAEEKLNLSGTVEHSESSGGGGEALGEGVGFESSTTVSTGHTIPAANVGVAIRRRVLGESDSNGWFEVPGVIVQVDGETVYSRTSGATSDPSHSWEHGGDASSSLQPGDHTITVTDAGGTGDGTMSLDVITLYDTRFTHTFPDSTNSSGYLPGPEEYPTTVQFETSDVELSRRVIAADLETEISSTAGAQSVAVSDDQGETFETATNASTLNTQLSGETTSLRLRVTLSRYGTRTDATPTTGFRATRLDAVSLAADVDETPLVVDRTVEGRLIDVVADICDGAGLVSELTYEPDHGATLQVTRPGQRETAVDPSLSDWSVDIDHDSVVEKVVVRGRSVPEVAEITASHGTAVELPAAPVQPGSERVVPIDSETDQSYDLRKDYDVDWSDGTITTLSSGSISDGEQLRVEFAREIRAVATTPSWDGDPTTVRTESLPGAATNLAAEQAARTILRAGSDPTQTVTATVDTGPEQWSLVDALDLEGVPQRSQLVTRDVSSSGESVTLRLGTTNPVDAVVSRLRSRLESTSRSV